MGRFLFFSDIDGTLVDEKLDWHDSLAAAQRIAANGDALVLCSSKPSGAIQSLLQLMDMQLPYICENGGGIVVPRELSKLHGAAREAKLHQRQLPEGTLIELAEPRAEIERTIRAIAQDVAARHNLPDMLIYSDMPQTDDDVQALKPYFPDWTTDQIRGGTLPTKYFDVAFQFRLERNVPDLVRQQLLAKLRDAGLWVEAGGLFYHALKGSDKGHAVRTFASLWQQGTRHRCTTIAIGDSPNDRAMLQEAQKAYNVQNRHGRNALQDMPGVICVPAIGPRGFSWVVEQVYA